MAFESHTEVLTSWKIGPFIFDYLHKKIYAIIKGFFLIKAISFVLYQFRDLQTIPLVMGEEESHEDPLEPSEETSLFDPKNYILHYQGESNNGSNNGEVIDDIASMDGESSVNGPDEEEEVEGDSVNGEDLEEDFNFLEDPNDFATESMGEVIPRPEGSLILDRYSEPVVENQQVIAPRPVGDQYCGVTITPQENQHARHLLEKEGGIFTEGQEWYMNVLLNRALDIYPANAGVPLNFQQLKTYAIAITKAFFLKRRTQNMPEEVREGCAQVSAEYCIKQILNDSVPILEDGRTENWPFSQNVIDDIIVQQQNLKAATPTKQVREMTLPGHSICGPFHGNQNIPRALSDSE